MPSNRWMAEVTYRDGTKPLFIEFEEIADLHDSVERDPNRNSIEQIVVTLKPRREGIEERELGPRKIFMDFRSVHPAGWRSKTTPPRMTRSPRLRLPMSGARRPHTSRAITVQPYNGSGCDSCDKGHRRLNRD